MKYERYQCKVGPGHILDLIYTVIKIQACKHVLTKVIIILHVLPFHHTSPVYYVVILEIHKSLSWFRNNLVYQGNINVFTALQTQFPHDGHHSLIMI